MTSAQATLARAALDLTVEALAERAEIAADGLRAFEAGGPGLDAASLARLGGTFEALGVVLVGDDKVELRTAAGHGAETVPLDTLNSANDE